MAGTALNPGDLLQFRVWSILNEQAAVSSFLYRVGTVTGTVSDSDVLIDFDTAIHTLYKDCMSADATYRGVQARIINRTPKPLGQNHNINAGAGIGSVPALPRQATGLISWQTPFTGQEGRGRTYMPFPPAAADSTGGIPSEPYLTALANLAGALVGFTLVTVGSNSCAMIFSLKSKKNTVPFVIKSFSTPTKWATQKRRGSYGRANSSPL